MPHTEYVAQEIPYNKIQPKQHWSITCFLVNTDVCDTAVSADRRAGD